MVRCTSGRSFIRRFIIGSVVLVLSQLISSLLSAGHPASHQVAQEQQIEITIRDYAFLTTKLVAIHPGLPTVILLENEDQVRHGFTSPFFLGVHVTAEGEGIAAYGKSMEGFYIDPGKSLAIRFVMPPSGRFTFECDVHKDRHKGMQGELFLLEVPVA